MKKNIVFMLQNGIGFGHFKLALTISEYLKEKCNISFITQAKSTEIFDNYDYKVYNFPMLYTLKSNNEILIINKIINNLLDNIKPDVVIEDTYPEDFYLNLPSLMNVSKVLLLNRLNSSEFENFYYNGILNQYDKLIVLKDKECFINDITSLEVKNYVNNSRNIVYLSGVFNEPSKLIKNNISKKYNINNYDKNIVVSCGAGGWHIGSNVCEDIFNKTIETTNILISKGINIQTILILGPYSKYLEKDLKSKIRNSNIKIVDFETHLDALFHVVDLCVLRPGYNSTMEAISGNSNVLLLPGISYMEDQEIWCNELKEKYGVDYLKVEELEKLTNKIECLLNKNIRKTNTVRNNTRNVAEEIYRITERKISNVTIRLAINYPFNQKIKLSNKLLNKNINILTKKENIIGINDIPVLNLSDIPSKEYSNYDSFIIYNDKNFEYERLNYYDTRYHIGSDGHVIVQYDEVVYENFEDTIKQLKTILNNPRKFNNNIVINIKETNQKLINEMITLLIDYLEENNIKIESLDTYLNEIVNAKASDFKYGYYRPEITKLS
ncbi:MAG: glycosyltransferase [bacterium]|nr:glycosyltransferase [bacterium]